MARSVDVVAKVTDLGAAETTRACPTCGVSLITQSVAILLAGRLSLVGAVRCVCCPSSTG